MPRWHLIALAAGAVIAGIVSSPANVDAVGICKCDNVRGFAAVCLPICKQANERTKFFRPAVYFGNDQKVSGDPSPLNGTSLKYLYISGQTRQSMEALRQYLEKHRNRAEHEFQQIRRAYLRGNVGPEEFEQAEKRRDEALVNYHHGMRIYLTTPSNR